MDAVTELKQEKAELLTEIAEAAQQGRSDAVLAVSGKLERIESLIRRYEQWESEVREIKGQNATPDTTGTTKKSSREEIYRPDFRSNGKSARERGREIREAFLRKLAEAGIYLQHIKGTIYKTKSGQRVGVAVATERQPDRWFLGLPTEGFDHAVLLCQRDKGESIEVCLPRKFFDQYGRRLSQSKDQVKFNIARKGNGYVVQIPGTDGVGVSEFLRGYSLLH